MIATAANLILNREDDHPARLIEARALLIEAAQSKKLDQAYVLLAEALFWLGEYATEKADKEKYFSEGVEHGKIAVEKAPDSAAAHLWYAANMGAHGLIRGIMSSLFYLGPIDQHGKRAIDLDESFFYGAPLRLMGRYYHQAPGWPVGKGDLGKAISHLEKAVDVGPEFLLNHLYLAEAYLAKRKKDDVRDLLDEIEAAKPSAFPMYQNRIKAEARELRKKL